MHLEYKNTRFSYFIHTPSENKCCSINYAGIEVVHTEYKLVVKVSVHNDFHFRQVVTLYSLNGLLSSSV